MLTSYSDELFLLSLVSSWCFFLILLWSFSVSVLVPVRVKYRIHTVCCVTVLMIEGPLNFTPIKRAVASIFNKWVMNFVFYRLFCKCKVLDHLSFESLFPGGLVSEQHCLNRKSIRHWHHGQQCRKCLSGVKLNTRGRFEETITSMEIQ